MLKISFQPESLASLASIYQPLFHGVGCVNASEDHVESLEKDLLVQRSQAESVKKKLVDIIMTLTVLYWN